MQYSPKKILVIQTAFIGDVVLATALLETLHKKLPDAEISILLRKGNETLLKEHPFLNKLWIWNKEKKYASWWSILQELRKEKFDWVINLQRFFSMSLFTVFSGAKFTIGFEKSPLAWLFSRKVPHQINSGTHEIERNFELVKELLSINETEKPKLYPSEIDFETVDNLKNKPYICIAPTSIWFTKQFPKEQWIDFINKVPEKYMIYILGSPSDKAACEIIKQKSKHTQINNLAGKLSLLASAALMKDAQMNYVNDSAPMHLASAVNAHVCAIFCSTIPAFGFGPLSDKSFIIESPKELICRPCGLHGKKECPEKHFNCAYNIEINKLRELID